MSSVKNLMIRFYRNYDLLWRSRGEEAHRCYTDTQKQWRTMSISVWASRGSMKGLTIDAWLCAKHHEMLKHETRGPISTPMTVVPLCVRRGPQSL